MKKKLIIVALTSLVLGGIIGGVVGSLYTTRMFAHVLLLLKQGEIYKTQDEAWNAYTTGNPQIAEWGLNQAIAAITDARSYGYPDTNELNQLEFEAEARLALINRDSQKQEVFNQHIAKAQSCAKQIPYTLYSSLITEEQVINFITKWDEAKKSQMTSNKGLQSTAH